AALALDDLHNPVKNGRSPVASSVIELPQKRVSSRWMTILEPGLQLPSGLWVSQPLTGDVRILPSNDVTFLRRPETTAQNVGECVEVSSPVDPGQQHSADLVKELGERRKAGPVNFIYSAHADQALRGASGRALQRLYHRLRIAGDHPE